MAERPRLPAVGARLIDFPLAPADDGRATSGASPAVGTGRPSELPGVRQPGGHAIPATECGSPGGIFVSYRHEDTAYPAGWLFDRLAAQFGESQVFEDVNSIELGDDFAEAITAAVRSCDVLLVLIGERWLTAAEEEGERRLDNPEDLVRLEIEAALARNVRVIPILVEGAQMPRASQLPASLAELARRNALELSSSRFIADTDRLLRVLDKILVRA
jgi:hypothetical protein